ncbi:putative transposase YbfD/YdcC [Streptacidiphilus sp. MAP12-16]|uniref:ISAs1 family transposase n=1 Tax=Streptacidiphilus sp. MAP12-16 TaxID=3156300 RepID=UPI0035187A1E
MLVAPSSLMSPTPDVAPFLASAVLPLRATSAVPEGLLDHLVRVPDPRDPRGVRYRLATLLAIGVCAMSAAGHNSLAAMAEWGRRCGQEELRRLGCPFDPFTGRHRVPDERTLRDAYGKVDPGELAAAGFAGLAALTRPEPARLTPDGVPEREQRRAHRTATASPLPKPRRTAVAVDGKCLRGAKRPDGSQIFILSALRHSDAVTLAAREIGAKTNEIPEFAPQLDQVDDADPAGAVVTVDALHAQRAHATYLVNQRGAHYLLTVKNNQPTPARQLQRLPWKDVPVLDRSTSRGHGREEVREVQVASVDGLLFPHAKQVVRIRRRRRRLGTRKWTSETLFAVTDLAAHQASAQEIATWARGHWTIENSVHWIRDVTFGEDASQVRTRNTPTVMAVLRDIVRGTLRLAGYDNTASVRRAHTAPAQALRLQGIP